MKHSAYSQQDYSFGQLMLTLRTAIGFTQLELADILKVSRQSVANWEAGRKHPKPDHLYTFIALTLEHHAFSASNEQQDILALWQAAQQKTLFDENWLANLLSQHGYQTTATSSTFEQSHIVDWDDAILVPNFFGREWELNLLKKWIIDDQCQVVTLLDRAALVNQR